MAIVGHVQLVLFSGQLKVHHIPVIQAVRAEILQSFPDGCISLITAMREARLPDPATRAAAIAMIGHLELSARGVAFVIEGQGVGISSLRTVLSAMILASRATQPHKVFDQAAVAVPWLAERSTKMGRPLTPTELGNAAHELRTLHLAQLQASQAAAAAIPA